MGHNPLLKYILTFGLFLFFTASACADPVKNGELKEYYDDGALMAVSNYKDDKLDGVQKSYYRNRKLSSEITYENGIMKGLQKQYYENGQLEAEWTADENEDPHGITTAFLEDGTQLYQARFEHGRFIGDDGKPFNGLREVKYPDGKLYSSANYIDGFKEGRRKEFYPDGVLKEEMDYLHNKRNGEGIQYFESGQIMKKAGFRNDEPDGAAFAYFENGQLGESRTYRDGKLNGEYKEFYEDGKLSASAFYTDDKITGQFIYFYPNGVKESVFEYDSDGNMTGETRFNKRGEVIKTGISFDIERKKIPYMLIWFIAFLFSMTIHEAAHALAAHKMGDDTAYHGGQVTLNPLPHIRREFLGTVVVPLLSFVSNGWMIGWASAPYDPQWADRYPKRSALMSLAGPAANLLVVAVCMVVMKAGVALNIFAIPDQMFAYQIVMATETGILPAVAAFISVLFYLNLLLFAFNLIPLPPLDGSCAVTLLMSDETARRYMAFINQASFSWIGLLAAWYGFGYLFKPIYMAAVRILFPEIPWEW